MIEKLEPLRERMLDLAAKINAPAHLLPSVGQQEHDAQPYVWIDEDGAYHLTVVERGNVTEDYATLDSVELLYRVFDRITFSMATQYELVHRIPNQDCRRLIFRRQLELLQQLNGSWAYRTERDHSETLKKYPYAT